MEVKLIVKGYIKIHLLNVKSKEVNQAVSQFYRWGILLVFSVEIGH